MVLSEQEKQSFLFLILRLRSRFCDTLGRLIYHINDADSSDDNDSDNDDGKNATAIDYEDKFNDGYDNESDGDAVELYNHIHSAFRL